MIPSLEAIKAINIRRGDAVVVSTTQVLREWGSVSHLRGLDVDLSDCVDKATSVGLGLALARPHRKVLVLDCDSVLRTGLSSLLTVGNEAPKNLVHFLFEDGHYISNHGQPVSRLGRINFKALVEDAGYPRTYQFNRLEDFVIGLQEVLEADGPTFVSLKVYHDRDIPEYPARTMGESFKAVREALEQEGPG